MLSTACPRALDEHRAAWCRGAVINSDKRTDRCTPLSFVIAAPRPIAAIEPRADHLVEELGMTYLADTDADHPLATLQAASCTYHIASGLRAGQKVPSLRTVDSRNEKITHGFRADARGLSLYAGVCCGADHRKDLERQRIYFTRPAIVRGRPVTGKGFDRFGSLCKALHGDPKPSLPLGMANGCSRTCSRLSA